MKKLFWLLLIAFIAIQFIPVDRTNPPVTADFNGPTQIKEILKTSCYDCHSNETKYEWYHKVAPASWLVARDVKKGRDELNFSEWGNMSNSDKRKMREEIWEEVEEGEMPMKIYTVMHKDAVLSHDQKEAIQTWSINIVDELIDIFTQ